MRRELANLLSIGIIVSETNNNRLYYEVNQDYEHYKSLASIFGDGKPASEEKKSKGKVTEITADTPKTKEDPIVKSLRSVGKVDLAILSGQFTRDETAGVDMLLVGDINQTKAGRVISEIEEHERKIITYAVLTTTEYTYRLQVHDRFIHSVLNAKKQVIINDQDLTVTL